MQRREHGIVNYGVKDVIFFPVKIVSHVIFRTTTTQRIRKVQIYFYQFYFKN